MDSMSLLWIARSAGLTIETDGERLILEGPRRAEPMARRLAAQKEWVLAALAAEQTYPFDRECPDCAERGVQTLMPRHWRRCRPCVLASMRRCQDCGDRPVREGVRWCSECAPARAEAQ